MIKKGFKAIISYTLPIMAGYIFMGIAFGLLVTTKGFPVWYAPVMSLVIFSGASEFAGVPLLSQAFDPIGGFFLSLMISLRHLFYGIPMLRKYSKEKVGFFRFFLIFWLSDETFSLVSTKEPPEGVNPTFFYVGISFMDYLYWNIGTLIGAFAGNMIGVNLEGLDFVLTALFIVLFIEQLSSKRGLYSGFTGLIATFASLMLFGSSKMIAAAMVIILVVLLVGRRIIDND